LFWPLLLLLPPLHLFPFFHSTTSHRHHPSSPPHHQSSLGSHFESSNGQQSIQIQIYSTWASLNYMYCASECALCPDAEQRQRQPPPLPHQHRRMRNYSMHFILYSFPPDGDATQYQHTQTHREKRNNLQK
jgi:hypothetical protein